MIADEEFIVSIELENTGNAGGGLVIPKDQETLLNAAKTKWESMGISNYHFGIFKECRCVFTQRIAIQVSNGEVIHMKTRFGEEVYQNITGYSFTIEDIFGLIKTGIDENYSTVDVEYDEDYGYPNKVVLDESTMRADDEYTLTIDYLAPLSKWQNELEAGKLLWSEQNLKTYNYTYQRFCECPTEYQNAKLVQVVDGNVVAIGGESVQATQRSSSISLDEAPTFDGLFTIIQDAITANAFRVGVDYDPKYGYPTSVLIDYDEMIADEEFIVSIELENTGNAGGGLVIPKDQETLLNAAKTKWESMGISNYHFGIFKECRCVFTQRIAIQVSNGEVIHMKTRFGEEVYQNITGYSFTIEDIFGLIKTGIDENYSTVDVEYDEDYGYPNKVVLDESTMRADDEYTLTIDYLAPLSKWQNELEAGKLLWSEQNLKTYNYTYQRFCECPTEYQNAKLVQVVDGNVVAIGGDSVQATQRSSSISLEEAPTLDGLFTIIQDAINANAFRVGVDYDPEYGYPTSVVIDYDEMIADEEFIVSAKLDEVKGGDGSADKGPVSSATKTATTVGHLGIASLFLCMVL
mmetsp:Transcript_13744/g.33288  ORF Transcript_13744/g.33288 Transcript_13744/m.33288 type:complete len:577 (-) Transcript_13744:92-1822(-)